MTQSVRFTSADLDAFPDNDGKRYEIIDGELYVSKAPSLHHQTTCLAVSVALYNWTRETGAGVAVAGPGIIFAEDDDVIPDVIWISNHGLATALGADGKLHAAPELVIEVLSPGAANEKRDRDAKMKLYSRRGVREYWILNWQRREVEVYRRANQALGIVATLVVGDALTSPLLPWFTCTVEELFPPVPAGFDG